MAPGDEWDAEKMLQVYILDYMKKKNMHTAAAIFANEANVPANPISIESPDGFLAEWWPIFYDVFVSRMTQPGTNQQRASAESSSQAMQRTENELQSLNPMVPNFEMNQQTPGQYIDQDNVLGQHSTLLSTAQNPLQQQIVRQPQQRVQRDNRQGIRLGRATMTNTPLFGVPGVPRATVPRDGAFDAEINEGVNSILPKKRLFGVDQFNSSFDHQGSNQLFQLPTHQPRLNLPRAQYQQEPSNQTLSHTTAMLGMDQIPSSLGMQGQSPRLQPARLQPQFQVPRAQVPQERSAQLLSHAPATLGFDQIPSGLGHQGLKPMLQTPQFQPEFQLPRAQYQQEPSTQLLSHPPTTLGFDQIPSGLGHQGLKPMLQPPKFQPEFHVPRDQQRSSTQLFSRAPTTLGVNQIPSGLGHQGLNPMLQPQKHQLLFQVSGAQHQQQPQIFSNTPAILGVDQIPSGLGNQGLNPIQGPNPQLRMPEALESNPKQQLPTIQHQQEPLTQILSNTPVMPSSSDILCTQTPMLPSCDLEVNNKEKMIQTEDTAEQQQHDEAQKQQSDESQSSRNKKSSSNSRSGDNILASNDSEKEKPMDENVESFLSPDDVNADTVATPFSILRQDSTDCNSNGDAGFSFKEVCRLQASKSKVLCCHFSTDGKMLASSGHDRKIMLWNMENYECIGSSDGHTLLVTDVRFKPNSAIFASSSFDKSVQIWDADKPSNPLVKLLGHFEQVTSVDFHPRKSELLCSCDNSNEIRLWNVNQHACTHITKGANKQVRFQPRQGKLLAAASGNCINIIDVETDAVQVQLKGHIKDVRTICWDTSGKYIASISEDSARVWSPMSSGNCVHELLSNGNNFYSCTFHPGYSQLLAVGGYQNLELWNPTESNKTLSISAHTGLITALADSPQAELIASASHDQFVKLWK